MHTADQSYDCLDDCDESDDSSNSADNVLHCWEKINYHRVYSNTSVQK